MFIVWDLNQMRSYTANASNLEQILEQDNKDQLLKLENSSPDHNKSHLHKESRWNKEPHHSSSRIL